MITNSLQTTFFMLALTGWRHHHILIYIWENSTRWELEQKVTLNCINSYVFLSSQHRL